MATLRKPKPSSEVVVFLDTLKATGTNDDKRGAAVDLSRATVRKMLSGDVSQMIEWLSWHPVLCAALLVDALRNTAPIIDAAQVDAVEAHLTPVGKYLEDAADRLYIAPSPVVAPQATPAIPT